MDQLTVQSTLKYLGLPADYKPAPDQDPFGFLSLHIAVLPQAYLLAFAHDVTPRQRTAIRLIKNRRTQYAVNSSPSALRWDRARLLEPQIWNSMNTGTSLNPAARPPPPPRPGADAADDEREWADSHFMGYRLTSSGSAGAGPSALKAQKGYVGRLGDLLAEYEEEREAERLRAVRIERAAIAAAERDTEEEFDSESSDEEDDMPPEPESEEEVRSAFERIIRERFIDGLLPVSLLYLLLIFGAELVSRSRSCTTMWISTKNGILMIEMMRNAGLTTRKKAEATPRNCTYLVTGSWWYGRPHLTPSLRFFFIWISLFFLLSCDVGLPYVTLPIAAHTHDQNPTFYRSMLKMRATEYECESIPRLVQMC